MIILTTKYCYVIIDIAPKGRLHLLIVARNGVLCPGDVSSPEFVLMNNGHPNAQKLLAVGVADADGDVYSWENL